MSAAIWKEPHQALSIELLNLLLPAVVSGVASPTRCAGTQDFLLTAKHCRRRYAACWTWTWGSVPPPLLLFGAKDSPSVQRRRRVSEDLADVWSTQSEVLRHALRPLAATWTLRVSGSFDLALVAQGSTLDDASVGHAREMPQ
ncbi:uncharacterized protein LOC119437350 isoform X3 [Dermacentor silvarum]|uniref:uncharacterized protein LOC119437350 isoform X3 n=1 Tax=Dermacentor silvarum TaxID=543639 RepID=UPI00189714AE|nr:uncharacterized protein LOC119437350 isoform X3 [Dermacentor silvarum]